MAEKPCEKRQRSICPECRGNGYIKIPHEIYADQFDVRQCERCSSEGEIDEI
jgi:DnaJ-class molecular chaperone